MRSASGLLARGRLLRAPRRGGIGRLERPADASGAGKLRRADRAVALTLAHRALAASIGRATGERDRGQDTGDGCAHAMASEKGERRHTRASLDIRLAPPSRNGAAVTVATDERHPLNVAGGPPWMHSRFVRNESISMRSRTLLPAYVRSGPAARRLITMPALCLMARRPGLRRRCPVADRATLPGGPAFSHSARCARRSMRRNHRDQLPPGPRRPHHARAALGRRRHARDREDAHDHRSPAPGSSSGAGAPIPRPGSCGSARAST